MTFGEALKTELTAIPALLNKVHPVIAPQETLAPFCVYRKTSVKFEKTLDGTLNKVEAFYNLTLTAKKYQELEDVTELVIQKILGFLFVSIGVNGPTIRNVTVGISSESYDVETELYIADIQLKVNY